MNDLLKRLALEAAAPVLEIGARFIKKVALLAVAVACLLVALIFLTIALYLWLGSLLGAINAALIVAAVYIVVAVVAILVAVYSARGSAPRRHAIAEKTATAEKTAAGQASAEEAQAGFSALVDQALAPVLAMLQAAGLKREQLALIAGAAIAKQFRPLTLVALTILLGFIVGRLFGKKA